MKSLSLISVIFLFCINFYDNKETRYLYHAGSFPWYVFYDSNSIDGCDIIEIGGVKYGFIDRLERTNNKDTISKSENGYLYYDNNRLFYYNHEIRAKFKLKKVKYKPSMKPKRSKIFETHAYFQYKKYDLSIEDRKKINVIINHDFESLENNLIEKCNSFAFEVFLKELNKI